MVLYQLFEKALEYDPTLSIKAKEKYTLNENGELADEAYYEYVLGIDKNQLNSDNKKNLLNRRFLIIMVLKLYLR